MAIVIVIMGLGVLSMSVLNPILPLYLTSIGVTPSTLGLMFSASMAGMAIGESFWGWAADRIGIKIPLVVGTFVSTLGTLSLILTPNIPALFAIFFFWGLVRSALFGPGRGFIAASAPLLKKATFMGIIAVMMSASRSIGAFPSGFIAASWGYDSVFFISAGISLFAGFLMLAGIKKIGTQKTTAPSVVDSSGETLSPYPRRLNVKSLSTQCFVTALRFLGLGILIAFLPLLATEVVGVGAAEVGILLSIGGITSMALGVPMGMLADRFGKKTFMVIGLLVSTVSMVGLAYSQSYLFLVASLVTHSIGMVVFSPAALGLLSDSVPRERQSTAMGIYGGVCENTGIIAGSALGGFVWSAFGPQSAFLMGAAAAGAAAVICFIFVREGRRLT